MTKLQLANRMIDCWWDLSLGLISSRYYSTSCNVSLRLRVVMIVLNL